jgi:phage shock protein PspC (stress-responsive transcriptional regulator)
MSKEGVSANTERVFRENETKANRMLTLIFNVVIMGIASGISRYFKYEKKWIKYLLIGTLTLVYAGTAPGKIYSLMHG